MAKGWNVHFDDSGLQRGLSSLEKALAGWMMEALNEMGDTLLLISRMEVPHDKGMLQASGHVFESGHDTVNVAYNTDYAAYQHEGGDGKRIIRNYQGGRKKKYLEDPLKMNGSKWENIAQNKISAHLKGNI